MNAKMYVDELTGFDSDTRTRIWLGTINYFLDRVKNLDLNECFDIDSAREFSVRFSAQKVAIDADKPKLYGYGPEVRFELNEALIEFIKSKSFDFWCSFGLEDPSFSNDETELVATISHEDYLGVRITDAEKDYFLKLGFALDCVWADAQQS